MRILAVCLALLTGSAGIVLAAGQQTASELAQITARGLALYQYDVAATLAMDAVRARYGTAMPQAPAGSRVLSICRPEFSGWSVDIGALSGDTASFVVFYRAVQAGPGARAFDVTKVDAPATGAFDVQAARAITRAIGDFQAVRSSPYKYAALQRADGQWYVYIYPGPTAAHAYPLGGDARYLVSADGRQIVARHRMHDGIIDEESASLPNGAHMAAGFHTVVVDDVPQDTDVFHVLLREPRVPDYVSAQGHMYKIDTNGSIEDLGTPTPTPRP
ncbi:MAG: hypothetical protein ACYC8W_06385 [Candidatus Tyrphobacter sp.]